MAMLSNLDLIRRVPLFAGLADGHAEMLANTVTKERYKRGDLLVQQGKMSNALFIILSGRARVLVSDPGGREVILATLSIGDCVGEMSLIDREPHSATVMAEQQLDALILGRDAFMHCLQQSSDMSFAVMYELVQRLRNASRKISSLALVGVYGRVATALLESAEPEGGKTLIIREKVTKQDLAKMVGASREMVSRVMKDFEEQGFIQTLANGGVRVFERRVHPR